MRSFIYKYNYSLLLIVIFVVAEIIVKPFGNFPLNDDWSYAKSVLLFNNTSVINIGMWPAMTLVTHLLWGIFFTKIFGFSFFVLRLSTMISSIIGILILNKLLFRISANRVVAFIGALILLFNPFYFNLTNTFMTDVNFNTLLLLCCYFGYDFFISKSYVSYYLVFFLSALLVLLRQYGIIVPFCFILASLILKERKWFFVSVSVLLTLVILLIFKWYEYYLKSILPMEAAYKFSSGLNPTQRIFWDIILENFNNRYSKILFHCLFYAFPFALLFFKGLLKEFQIKTILLVSILNIIATYFLFRTDEFQMVNVFVNMSLGTETFFQTLKGTDDGNGHTFTLFFTVVVGYLKFLFSAGTAMVITFFILKLRKQKKVFLSHKIEVAFLLLIFVSYIIMILVTESFFDRYHIPLITLSIIFLAYITNQIKLIHYKFTIIPLLLFFYVSVFGTRDYFTLHEKSWQAYNYLRKEKKIESVKINPGFEVYNWNEGKESWWWEFMEISNFDYIIQYNSEPNFKILKEYEFQRYFPYKKDKIYIFVREGIK